MTAATGIPSASRPFSPAFYRNPYPVYRRLRDHSPAHPLDDHGLWLVVSFDDVARALRDFELFSSAPQADFDPVMLGADPPAHARWHELFVRAFARERIAGLDGTIREIAAELLGSAGAEPTFDLIASFARPLPVRVMARIFGFPRSSDGELLTWCDLFSRQARGLDPVDGFPPAFEEFWASQTRDCRAGTLAETICDSWPGSRKSAAEILGLVRVLLVAGTETTSNLIGNAILALLREPRLAEEVRARPESLAELIEEVLRCESPVQTTYRRTTREVSLGGVEIPGGSLIGASLGAANRDPTRFEDPEVFHPGRGEGGHLAFGAGPHACPGMHLARLEARAALGVLLSTWSSLESAQTLESADFVHSPSLRGLTSLRVRPGA